MVRREFVFSNFVYETSAVADNSSFFSSEKGGVVQSLERTDVQKHRNEYVIMTPAGEK